jgi:hypothetical protein
LDIGREPFYFVNTHVRNSRFVEWRKLPSEVGLSRPRNSDINRLTRMGSVWRNKEKLSFVLNAVSNETAASMTVVAVASEKPLSACRCDQHLCHGTCCLCVEFLHASSGMEMEGEGAAVEREREWGREGGHAVVDPEADSESLAVEEWG